MKKKAVLFLLLSGLLVSCSSPTTAATTPAAASAIPTQSSPQTITPLPSATPTQTSVPTPEATPTPLTGSNLILERVAQLGGSIIGITIVGEVAYVGMGPRVAVFDIRQYDKPQLVRQSEPLPGAVTQLLQVSGGPAPFLLVNAGKYLVVMDTTSPGELKPVRQLELQGAVTALVWDAGANILYAGGSIFENFSHYTGFISSVELSANHDLKLIDTVSMPEYPISMALGKGSLFAGADGLYYSQVKTPGELTTPRQVIASTPEDPLQPLRMQVVGERLYLSYRGLRAYDISDPDLPREIWGKNLQGGPVLKDFQIAGDHVYAFGWTILNEYVRFTIPLPEPIEGSPTGASASVTAMHDGAFLVAYNDLEIYAPTKSQDLLLVASYKAPVVNAIGAVANEKAVFVVDHGIEASPSTAVLQVLSLPDLKPLSQVTIEFPNSWNYVNYPWIALDNDRLYLASANSVWVYDVSKLQPGLLGKVDIPGGRRLNAIQAFTRGEKRLLLISQEVKYLANNLLLYDLTDLQKPALLGSPLSLDQGTFQQMTLNLSALYFTMSYTPGCHCGMLSVVDIKDNALTLRGSLQVPQYINDIAIEGDLIAVTSTQGLSLVSAAGTEPLKLLPLSTLPGEGIGAAIINKAALVVVGGHYGAAQLLTFDIQNPANPRQVKAIDIAVSGNYVVPILVTQSYVILVNGAGGVEVFSTGR